MSIIRLARRLPCGALALALSITPSMARDAAEHWVATSDTAMSITGDITLTPEKIIFHNGKLLSLAVVGHVPKFGAMGDAVDATIYRVTAPADPLLQNGNHLCGGGRATRRVTYIAVWSPPKLPGDNAPRSLAAFSGEKPPRSTAAPDCCGVYNFELS